MTNPDREELVKLDETGLEAAVRECARITAPEITDNEYEQIKADNSPRYQNTRAEMARTIRAYLASSDSGMKVRELEWSPHPAGGEQALAAGLGLYRVHRDGSNWYLVPDHMGEGGKAAAQADYEARIKSALVEVPAVKGEPEPVAWRDIIKRPDERPLPTYGQIPWAQLGRDVNDATFGRRADFEFSDKVYPGHQMVLGINFNSLARIVDKYRYYGLPCTSNPITAPPADAGMREAVQQAIDEAAHLASIHAHHALWSGLLPYGWDSATEQFGRNLAGAIAEAIKVDLPKRLPDLTAPGATTKSDGGARSLTADETRLVEQALRDSGELVEPLLGPSDSPFTYTIAHDGFIGTIQGHYVTREGKEGVVLQQVGTRVVHVYGRKWIDADLPSDPSSTRSEVTVDDVTRGIYEVLPSFNWSECEQAARALFDQFEIRRKK